MICLRDTWLTENYKIIIKFKTNKYFYKLYFIYLLFCRF